MQEVKAAVLAIEANKTLMFNRTEMQEIANQAKIAIWGLDG
jgi:DUF1009 family protein